MRTGLGALLSVAIVAGAAGCGSGHPGAVGTERTTGTSPVPGVRPAGPAPAGSANAREFAGRAGAARFRVLVNDVCQAVRARAPAALDPRASDAAVRSHAAAGAAATRGTLTAFVRLSAPTTALVLLRPLSGDYERLARLYADVVRPGSAHPRAYLPAITRAERTAAAAALAGGFPACGPAVGRGRSK